MSCTDWVEVPEHNLCIVTVEEIQLTLQHYIDSRLKKDYPEAKAAWKLTQTLIDRMGREIQFPVVVIESVDE